MSVPEVSVPSSPAAQSPRGPGWVPMLGGLLGLCWYAKAVGAYSLSPLNIDWLGDRDMPQHMLGWLFFRNEPWALPLGSLPSLIHPLGSTVGYTDSNPWVSLLLKPLSPWLPEDFQFIGPWLGLCFALQGFFGARLVACFTPRALHQLLGAALFVLTPLLLHRLDHDTLCAHWLLLGMLWLYLHPAPPLRGNLGWATFFNLVAAGTHPYLLAMVLCLTLALLVRLQLLEQRLGLTALLAWLGSLGLVLGGIFVLLGYVGQGVPAGSGGFGTLSADLLTLFNSMGQSRWLPPLPLGKGQYEGFGFLGTGALGLGAVAGGWALWRREQLGVPWRLLAPLLAGVGLLALFAFSSQVSVAGQVVLTLRTLYRPLAPLVEPFRSSGRFIWPLHYLVLASIIALTLRLGGSRPAAVTALLLVAVGVQAAEVKGVWPGSRLREGSLPRLRSPDWSTLQPYYHHLVLYPPFINGKPPACGEGEHVYQDFLRLAYVAYRQRLTINSGYAARLDESAIRPYCRELVASVEEGRMRADTVYIVHPKALEAFTREGSGMLCGQVEGYNVCVSASQPSPLRDRFATASSSAR